MDSTSFKISNSKSLAIGLRIMSMAVLKCMKMAISNCTFSYILLYTHLKIRGDVYMREDVFERMRFFVKEDIKPNLSQVMALIAEQLKTYMIRQVNLRRL